LLATIVLGTASCAPPSTGAAEPAPPAAEAESAVPNDTTPGDPHSFAEPGRVRVTHMGADWTVDFEGRRLEGAVTLAVDRLDPSAPLLLDTRALDIRAVTIAQRPESSPPGEPIAELDVGWTPTKWSLGESDPILGAPLTVELPASVDLVRVEYRTTAGSTGLQWLDPSQTAGGHQPFLYSQSQAIHARSWIPCQDTPGVRVTYDAVVRTPPQLVPLMSADRVEHDAGVSRFSMPQAISSYLIALAVGDLEFQALGDRAGVWAEPSTLPTAATEFADVERMMQAAESLYGPYRWGRYDILVLPPAFPFGGMENPRLTFATPTILAGDRSLVALVAHELAHSWSGNLVTNATWRDIWLNEGFTVYIERRIVEQLYGVERASMEAALGRQDLERALQELGEPDEHLVADLQGRDPDDGLGDIPYEKGALFLETLEVTYGRERFDPFLQAWFDEHAFGSVDTEEFERFATERLVEPNAAQVKPPDFDAWIHGPGIGPGAPAVTGDAFAKVDAVVEQFEQGKPAKKLDVASFTPHEWLRFLRAIDAEVTPGRLAELDRAHGLTRSGNSEIVAQWLQISITGGYHKVDERLEQFLLTVGRRKFLMPLYRRLLDANRRDEAIAIYQRARSGYHPITQQSLDALLSG
jgi:aminopeptidase N